MVPFISSCCISFYNEPGEETIPGGTYEISLDDPWFSAADDSSLHLSTDRASYLIEVMDSAEPDGR